MQTRCDPHAQASEIRDSRLFQFFRAHFKFPVTLSMSEPQRESAEPQNNFPVLNTDRRSPPEALTHTKPDRLCHLLLILLKHYFLYPMTRQKFHQQPTPFENAPGLAGYLPNQRKLPGNIGNQNSNPKPAKFRIIPKTAKSKISIKDKSFSFLTLRELLRIEIQWCPGRLELPPSKTRTSPSSWRVYQFRHLGTSTKAF